MAAVDYYNTGDDLGYPIKSTFWYCQTFTASVTYTISSVKLLLYRVGSPGTVTVSIRATASGVPTGADIISGTTNGNTLTTNTAGEWREITFSSTTSLTSGTVYAICVRSSVSTYELYWRYDSTSPSYSGGTAGYSVNSGSTWTAVSGSDMMFETYQASVYLDLTGTIAGIGTITGTLTVATVVTLTGSISGSGSITGTLTVGGGLPTANYTRTRLIVIGTNALWYET